MGMKTTHRNAQYNLAPMLVEPRTQADLKSRGFDGTMWLGTPKRGRSALFYRTTDGEFHFVTKG